MSLNFSLVILNSVVYSSFYANKISGIVWAIAMGNSIGQFWSNCRFYWSERICCHYSFWTFCHAKQMNKLGHQCHSVKTFTHLSHLRDVLTKKICCSFGFCPNVGGSPAQILCHLFRSAFLVNNRSLFPPKCR